MSNEIVLLGLGNVLCADEGFGVRCIEALDARFVFPEQVRLVDGGTRGIALLAEMEGAERVLLFDAVDFGLPPGELALIGEGEIPRFISAGKLSLHQTGFQDVLAYAQITGTMPPDLRLIGIQPVVLDDYGGDLSPEAKAQIPGAIELALTTLAAWGIRPKRRPA